MAKKKGTLKDMVKAPRTIDINGQLHMLAWITPQEGKVLKNLGGSGKKGPMGIPAYVAGNVGGFSSQAGDSDIGFGGGSSSNSSNTSSNDKSFGNDGPMGMEDEYDPFEGTGKTAAEVLGYDLSSQVKGQDDRPFAGITKDEYESLPGYMKSLYNVDDQGNITGKGISEIEKDETGRVTGFYHEGKLPSVLGAIAKAFGFTPTVYTGFGKGAYSGSQGGDGSERVAQQITAPVSVTPTEEDTPLTQAMKDYYAMGVGTATKPAQLTDIISSSESPIGSRYDKEKGLLYLADGTIIDVKTGQRVNQSKIKPLRISGLEMFKPIGG